MGAPAPHGGRQCTILPNFPKNFMKLKEFGPPGGASLGPPLDVGTLDVDTEERGIFELFKDYDNLQTPVMIL